VDGAFGARATPETDLRRASAPAVAPPAACRPPPAVTAAEAPAAAIAVPATRVAVAVPGTAVQHPPPVKGPPPTAVAVAVVTARRAVGAVGRLRSTRGRGGSGGNGHDEEVAPSDTRELHGAPWQHDAPLVEVRPCARLTHELGGRCRPKRRLLVLAQRHAAAWLESQPLQRRRAELDLVGRRRAGLAALDRPQREGRRRTLCLCRRRWRRQGGGGGRRGATPPEPQVDVGAGGRGDKEQREPHRAERETSGQQPRTSGRTPR